MLHPLPGILPFLFRPFWFIQLHFSQSSCLECEIACGLQLHSAFYIFLGEGGEWVLGGGIFGVSDAFAVAGHIAGAGDSSVKV